MEQKTFQEIKKMASKDKNKKLKNFKKVNIEHNLKLIKECDNDEKDNKENVNELVKSVFEYLNTIAEKSFKLFLETEYKREVLSRIVNEKSKCIKIDYIEQGIEYKERIKKIIDDEVRNILAEKNKNEKELTDKEKNEIKQLAIDRKKAKLDEIDNERDEKIKEIDEYLNKATDDEKKEYYSKIKKYLDTNNYYREIANSGYYVNTHKSTRGNIEYILEALEETGQTLKEFKLIYEYVNNDPGNEGGNNMQSKKNNEPIEKKIKNLIQKGKIHQIILTGAPGTGKTYMAKRIAEDLGQEISIDSEGNPIKYEFVQFHPSYDYTDFVEGIRPCESNNESDKIGFKKVDGIFKAFCREVVRKKDEKKLYFFIIDEINRADLSKVFGELMFGLEKDKRGEKIKTQYSNLKTYDIENKVYLEEKEKDTFKDGFYIPQNVVVIGTMNDIDRSVESMDFALRRRFTWVDVEVNKKLLTNAFLGKEDDMSENKCIELPLKTKEEKEILIECILNLNEYITKEGSKTYSLDKNYYISQGQFSNISEDFKDNELLKLTDNEKDYIFEDVQYILQWVWEYRLESLIKEYIRGYFDEDFIKGCEEALYEKNIKTKDNDNKQNDKNTKDKNNDNKQSDNNIDTEVSEKK